MVSKAFFGYGVRVQAKDLKEMNSHVGVVGQEEEDEDFDPRFSLIFHGQYGHSNHHVFVCVRESAVVTEYDEAWINPDAPTVEQKQEWRDLLAQFFTEHGCRFTEPEILLTIEFTDI